MSDTFILASGKSLLDLSSEEKNHINKSLCISFNKYLMFYDKVGIIPNYHYQLDAFDKSGIYVFQNTINKILKDKLYNIELICGSVLSNLILSNNIKIKHKITSLNPKIGNGWNPNFEDIGWSSDPYSSLFHFKGSLTSVINFAHALKPNNDIKLLGADMTSSEYFFNEEFEKDSNMHDWTYDLMKKTGKHSSALTEVGGYTQEICMPWIKEQTNKTGSNIYICSKKSLYYTENILEYKEVI